MSADSVKTVVAHWLPRFLQNGVDYNDFERTVARITSWEQWLPEWNASADDHAAFARENEVQGNWHSAGEAWLRASAARHFGKFVWMVDRALMVEATRTSADELRTAHGYLDPSAEHLEFSVDGGTVYANLRKPSGVEGPPPWVVVLPGLDSTKEELYYLENAFLQRGMATLTMDGHGQGETRLSGLFLRHDYEAGVTPVLDVMLQRSDLDGARVGICGVSLGGYYAPRVAAFEPRFKAVVGGSGPYMLTDLWEKFPEVTRQTFTVNAGVDSQEEAFEVARTLDLTGVCQRIKVPALYFTGDADRLVPWQHNARQAEETPLGEFVNYPGGSHVVGNIPYRARPMLADWLQRQLTKVIT